MILYHGSFVAIKQPDLKHSRSNVDFGKGFYLTPICQQAAKWSERFKRRGQESVVSRYDFDEAASLTLKTLRLDSYSEEWLDFILSCRKGQDATDYDLVIGGVADDKIFNTIELYLDGLIDKAEAIGRLRYEKPNWQLAFRTEKSLSFLKFIDSKTL